MFQCPDTPVVPMGSINRSQCVPNVFPNGGLLIKLSQWRFKISLKSLMQKFQSRSSNAEVFQKCPNAEKV